VCVGVDFTQLFASLRTWTGVIDCAYETVLVHGLWKWKVSNGNEYPGNGTNRME
jgi:hypothetical protein